jgi:hypothetical protein
MKRKSITTAFSFIISATALMADNSILTEKEDQNGRKKSVIKNCSGHKTGEIISEKPDYYGRKKKRIQRQPRKNHRHG